MNTHIPFLLLCILFIVSPTLVHGEEVTIGRFSSGDLNGWKEKIFKGKTLYSLARDNGRTVLMAHSAKAASGLIREVNLDPLKYPLLRWSWKIDHVIRGEDVTRKSGDDFAARVYVVFPRTFFWQLRGISYVWASRMPKGSAAPDPYTRNAMIVAVESGDAQKGEWISEERNIREDYRNLFDEEPPPIGAIAVMTDTDDTGEEATAWYGDILIRNGDKGLAH